MSQRFVCSKMPAGLMFSFCVFLLPSVLTHRNTNHIYFLDEGADIRLKGPDNPGDGPVVWEWKAHSGQVMRRLVTFHKRSSGWWDAQWNDQTGDQDLYRKARQDSDTINLRIYNPTFKLAGSFILTQTQPSNKTLKLYELFGIKVERSPQRAVVGSDVTLSCTISKLSDTVSLQWKPRDSSQQDRRNTDQIRLNNTVYLIVRHVAVEDQELYTCEVQENGSSILTGKAHFSVANNLYQESYTLYRSGTDRSELDLICYSVASTYNAAAWTWSSHHLPNQEKKIATASKSQPIDVNRTDFGSRLVPTVGHFNGRTFSVRIVPVLFDDAGVYTCSLESSKFVTIKLITVKAEPSDAETEGDTVTPTCSVSDVTEPMRLVWINSDGRTVGEKTLNGRNGEEKSLRLIIQKADRGRGNWICAVFYQNQPQVLVPYYLEPSDDYTFKHTNVVIFGSLALLLVIVLTVVLCLRKRKVAGVTEMPVPETSRVAENTTVNRKAKVDDTEREDIHYGSIAFQTSSPGSRHGTQCNKQSSDPNLAPSKEDGSSVIYAQIAQADYT
uniref:uncharacterized protein isoform X2 n=1 Tax=Pristiophorus japonicus TaxID=55135 RepID=UPI00398EA5D4